MSDDLFARPTASHYGLTTFRLTNFAQPWQFQSLRKMILRTPQIRFRSVWSDVLVLLANRTKWYYGSFCMSKVIMLLPSLFLKTTWIDFRPGITDMRLITTTSPLRLEVSSTVSGLNSFAETIVRPGSSLTG